MLGTKTCTQAVRFSAGRCNRRDAVWANVPASALTGQGYGVIPVDPYRNFTGSEYQVNNSIFRFNTDIGGRTVLSAQFTAFVGTAAVDSDGCQITANYYPAWDGTAAPSPSVDWVQEPTTPVAIAEGDFPLSSATVVGTQVSATMQNVGQINTTGFTNLRFVIGDSLAAPTGMNTLSLYQFQGTPAATLPPPAIVVTFQVDQDDVPAVIHGHGAM